MWGAFNLEAPQTQYADMWDVKPVLQKTQDHASFAGSLSKTSMKISDVDGTNSSGQSADVTFINAKEY